MTNVLAIFTCYNRKKKTEKCLKSLIDNNVDINFHFVVCDDGSTDGTSEMLKDFKNIMVVNGNGKLFYTGGMRKAIEVAQTFDGDFEYVLLMNDDVEFFDHAIEKLVVQHKNLEMPQKSLVVGSTSDYEGRMTYGGVVYPYRFRMRYKKYGPKSGVECDTFHANCVLIPFNIFKSSGNMDEHYSHSLGDFDYGLKISRAGNKIVISDDYVGYCVIDAREGGWEDTSLSIRERIKKKESFKGVPTGEWFYYANKNFGLFRAVVSTVSPFVRIILKK